MYNCLMLLPDSQKQLLELVDFDRGLAMKTISGRLLCRFGVIAFINACLENLKSFER
ncbi:hypothetical protein [Coleofasciculus sp. FACHB-501]|uniref:hypothetical protein n=1 Tax=Cyanophyceae TaxID=3028117 RepID=UPI0016889AE2|nr:hypothetical protein [Coleofasciculus sp. FACHB-501]